MTQLSEPIPKIIHQIWVGPSRPEQIDLYRATWRDCHPGWQYRLWDEESLAGLRMTNRTLYDNAEKYCLPGRVHQFRSDIARYEILFQHGGVYVDADFQCLRPVDDLMTSEAWLAWESQGQWLCNAIFAARPKHPFVTDLRDGLQRNVSAITGRNGPVTTSRLSGPKYVTRMWNRRRYGTVSVLPRRWFYPYSWNELERGHEDFDEAYAVHHWMNQRRLKGLDLPGGDE